MESGGLGQAILIGGALLYTSTHYYDVHKEIEVGNNEAAGMSFGGFLVALGFIAGGALTGATHHLGEEIAASGVLAGFGVGLLLAARVLVDKLLMPGSSLAKEVAEDQNPAAGALAAASFVLVALLLANATRSPQVAPVPVPAPAAETGGGQ